MVRLVGFYYQYYVTLLYNYNGQHDMPKLEYQNQAN